MKEIANNAKRMIWPSARAVKEGITSSMENAPTFVLRTVYNAIIMVFAFEQPRVML